MSTASLENIPAKADAAAMPYRFKSLRLMDGLRKPALNAKYTTRASVEPIRGRRKYHKVQLFLKFLLPTKVANDVAV